MGKGHGGRRIESGQNEQAPIARVSTTSGPSCINCPLSKLELTILSQVGVKAMHSSWGRAGRMACRQGGRQVRWHRQGNCSVPGREGRVVGRKHTGLGACQSCHANVSKSCKPCPTVVVGVERGKVCVGQKGSGASGGQGEGVVKACGRWGYGGWKV